MNWAVSFLWAVATKRKKKRLTHSRRILGWYIPVKPSLVSEGAQHLA